MVGGLVVICVPPHVNMGSRGHNSLSLVPGLLLLLGVSWGRCQDPGWGPQAGRPMTKRTAPVGCAPAGVTA